MSEVQARFSLLEVARVSYWGDVKEGCRVKLQAVKGEPFGSATPSGTVEMLILNPSAASLFLDIPLGTEYDVFFHPRGGHLQ